MVEPLNVLIACEESGTVRDAFIAMGHNAISCDLKPTRKKGPHLQCDVRDVLHLGWDLMIAHPVCKRLANSGVRWLDVPPKGKTREQMWQALEEAAEFYCLLRDAPIPHKCIENPVMHAHARKRVQPGYRQIVQPWWFGDPTFKATGFELINLPDLVPTDKLTPPAKGTPEHKAWSWVHMMPPGPNRERDRSVTQPGIARAMAEQWPKWVTPSNAIRQAA